jgi:lipopolysaccharide/colanic/teichoic acid biosynthesis glycosyltransferase
MAFFGPPPVRLEFARRLGRLAPVYAHRFTVKPGILGWSQINLANTSGTPDEALRLEYDLYYVKQNSVSLDLEVLLRTIFRSRTTARRAAPSGRAGSL